MERPDGAPRRCFCSAYSSSERTAFLTPGVPTAEEVSKLLQRKDQIEAQLANLEKCAFSLPLALTVDRQIYNLETSYLEDTYNVGTALKVREISAGMRLNRLKKGWDALTGRSSGSGAISVRRKLRDEDRIFSLSSATSMRVRLLLCLHCLDSSA